MNVKGTTTVFTAATVSALTLSPSIVCVCVRVFSCCAYKCNHLNCVGKPTALTRKIA